MSIQNIHKIAHLYDKRALMPFDGTTYKNEVWRDLRLFKRLFKRVMPLRDSRICDVGCGFGWHLEALAHHGHQYLWGIDVSIRSLQNFLSRAPSVQSGLIHLVTGDVTVWGVSNFFDTVTSFLSCIGTFHGDGDQIYFSALHRLLCPCGLLLLTAFCEERASELEGQYVISYSKEDPTKIITTVVCDVSTSTITIRQILDTSPQDVLIEKIHLYNTNQIRTLAQSVGFIDTQIMLPEHGCDSDLISLLPKGCMTLVARKGRNS